MDVSNKANHICHSNETSNVGLKTSIPELKRAHLSSLFKNRSLSLQPEPEVPKTQIGNTAQRASNEADQLTLNKRCLRVKNKLSDTCSSARMKNIESLNNLNSNKRRTAFLKSSNSFINNNLPEAMRNNFVYTNTIASAGRLDSNNIISNEQSGVVSKVKLIQLKIKKKLFDFTISIQHHFITIALVIIALFSNDLKILCLPPSLEIAFECFYALIIFTLLLDSIISCICLPNYALSFQHIIDCICPIGMILEFETVYSKFTFLNIYIKGNVLNYIDHNKLEVYIRMVRVIKMICLVKLFDYFIAIKEHYKDKKLAERLKEIKFKKKEKRKKFFGANKVQYQKDKRISFSNNNTNINVPILKRNNSTVANPKDYLSIPKKYNDLLYNNGCSNRMNKFSDNKSQLPLLSLSVKDDTSNISHVNLPHQSSIVHFQANSPGYTNNNNTINNPQKKEEKQSPSFTADDYYKQEKQYLEKNEKSINKLILTKINHKNIIVIVSVCFIYPLTDGNCFQKQHNHTYNSIASVLDNVMLSDKDDFEIFTTDFNEVFESYLNEVTSYYYPILNITKPHPHNINEQIVLYQNKTLNNKQYRIEEIGINIHKPKGSVIVFCLKQKTIMRSVIEICRTFYIIVLIYLLTSSINRVSSTLLLNPIEDMIKIIDIVSKDPVNSKTIDNLKKNVVGSIENIKKKKKNSDYEIKVIQFAIIRISALMAIGFGEAGGEILKENIQSSEGLNPMLEGKKIIAIFGFCYIRHFAEINEVLQEKTMIFVNRISEIVHSAVDKFGGITNKNLGDCFLLVWKFKEEKLDKLYSNDALLAALNPSSNTLLIGNNRNMKQTSIEEEERSCFLSDCALLAFLSVIKKINKSRTILEYSNNKALKERLGENFRVQMGFGLHMGWGIEGAIGSFYKIDCSYLSPNVNIAARLETATNIYGVDILFSGEFYDTLSTYMKKFCRKIDIVALKGCVTPVTLYTVDCNKNIKPGKPKINNKKFNIRERRMKKQILRALYEKQTLKTISEVYMLKSKGLRHLLKDSKTEAFLQYFDEGYTQYINGDWEEAYRELKNALFLDNTDGPTKTLMKYIKRFNKVAPDDWDGFRKLESKT